MTGKKPIDAVSKKRILKFTEKVNERIINGYLEMRTYELASFYIMSGENERVLMEEALKRAPAEYAKRTRFYIEHPLELRDRLAKLSRLERDVK